ncbi:MAG TPA: hypothetical protein VEC38_13690 [Candidatus Binataceae bacterium]|nr:hypothetical protein [Candidatus Binataceae bacterium]
MFDRCRKLGIVTTVGAFVLGVGLAGCGSIQTNRADCIAVKLQTQAGVPDAQIASALGVSEADVQGCRATKAGASEPPAPAAEAPAAEGQPPAAQ